MSQQTDSRTREGLDLKTLVLTAAAAAIAAIVTQAIWGKGALISSALTPVIIALVREALDRPATRISEKAARVTVMPGRGAAALAAGAGKRNGRGAGWADDLPTRRQAEPATPPTRRSDQPTRPVEEPAHVGAGAGPAVPPPPFDDTRSYEATRPLEPEDDGAAPTANAPASAAGAPVPPRVYGRRRFRLKHALLTAVAAFAIAVAALTIPELVLGGSIAGGDRTTLFGGGGERDGGEEGVGDSDDSDPEGPGTSEPQSVPDSGGSVPAPDGSEPAPEDEAVPAPEEEAPEAAPAPAPTPSAPSPSGSAQPSTG